MREDVARVIWEQMRIYMAPVGLDAWASGKVADAVLELIASKAHS